MRYAEEEEQEYECDFEQSGENSHTGSDLDGASSTS